MAKRASKQPPDMDKVVEAVKKLAELTVYLNANLKSVALVLNSELGIGLDLPSLTAHEAEKRSSVPTPLGEAKSRPGAGEIPPPENGNAYTATEL